MVGVLTTRIGEFLESCPYHQLGQDRFRVEPITVTNRAPFRNATSASEACLTVISCS